MESTTVRYDFSFPPKSQANNGGGYQQTAPPPNNYRHQNNNQHFNMSKSVSSSLLSCATTNNYQQHSVASANSGGRFRGGNNTCYGCTGSNRCQYHHHRNYNRGGQQQYQYQQQQQQQQQAQLSQSSSQSSIQTVTSSGSLNGSGPTIVAPGTPKDGNCSFTFDELKNTLSFMDDSPLVNTSSSNTAATTNTQTMLMVNPGHAGEGLSMHSGGSSSSGVSSASHVSSSSNQLPKSISNPMILSSCSSASSLSAVSTSPVSMNSSSSCGNGDKRPLTGGHYHHHQHNNRHSVGSRSECGCNHHNQANNQSPPSGGECSSALPPLAPPSSASSTSSSSGRHTVGNSEVYMRRSSYNESASSYDNQQPAYHTSLIQPVSVVSGSAQQQQQQQSSANSSIETAAKKYRFAAQNSEATCHWSGKLPPKQYKPPLVYSTKVFVGGLPWDICENDLLKEFGVFGPCRIEFTNKDRFYMQQNQSQQQDFNGNDSQQGFRHNRSMVNLKHANGSNIMSSSSSQSLPNGDHQSSSNNNNNNNGNNSNKQRTSPGFAYVIYDNECSVRSLVGNCIEDYQNGRDRVEYYYKISTRRVRNKEVQIIPWILADNNFATCTPKDLDPKKTVFVGNLHGTMTARDLAHIMNELFGSVVYAGIDIDKLKYPIGSGRVTFAHQQNFMRAVRAAFVDINSFKFAKRIQIDPYLEDVQCCLCMNDKGIYFCRDFQCFNYYCGGCWEKQHSFNQMGNHKPLMRKREDKY